MGNYSCDFRPPATEIQIQTLQANGIVFRCVGVIANRNLRTINLAS
ncbi:hypothetical protein [Paenibacillus sp. UMB4589-SE434]|nr:hypothetical protein [Paenibacillus sp. UMB4589-SE434]